MTRHLPQILLSSLLSLYMTVMDEPQGLPETHGLRTAGWNVGVVTGKLIERTGPLLGGPPRLGIGMAQSGSPGH